MKQTYKIGIAIVHCLSKGNSSGFEVVHTTDKDNWVDTIEDTGRVFNYVANTSESIIRLIKLDSEGWYICSMIPTTDREHEYRASWIYLPSAMNLNASDIKSILSEVESQITTSDFDESRLNTIAERYSIEGSTSYPHFIVSVDRKGYAIRYVGGANPSLYDIFDNIYQKEYGKYNWIVLLPERGTELVPESNISDITRCKFSTSITINPENVPNGFIPYFNNKEFVNPIRLFNGETIKITWKKNGYADVPVTVSNQDDFCLPLDKILRRFPNSITIVDRLTKKRINSAKIKMITNCSKDKEETHIFIAEKDLESVKFEVSAVGYDTEKFCLNLASIPIGGSIPDVELKPEEHKYIFVLPIDGGVVKGMTRIKIEIKSQFRITESPIKGYSCYNKISEDSDNELRYKQQVIVTPGGTGCSELGNGDISGSNLEGKKRLLQLSDNKLYIIIALIAFCIIVVSLVFFLRKEGSQPCTQTSTQFEVVESHQDQINDSWKYALNALIRSETVWDNDSLSKYEDLDGVYDMINKYKFTEIISFYNNHESDLSKIDDWKRLYQYAQTKADKTGEYSQDGKITISNYLKKISELPDKSNATVSSAASTSTGNSSTSSSATNGTNNNETNTSWE